MLYEKMEVKPLDQEQRFVTADPQRQGTDLIPNRFTKTMNCHICKREYSVKKLEEHITLCKRSWEQIQEKLPIEKRQPCPKAPDSLFNILEARKSLGSRKSSARGSIPNFG